MHGNTSTNSARINAFAKYVAAIKDIGIPDNDNDDRLYQWLNRLPSDDDAPMLAAALSYAAVRGRHVFLVPPGTKKSHKAAEYSGGRNWGATTDAKEIRRDFRRWPDANVGIVTGPKSGIWVVEADTLEGGHAADGIASLTRLQDEHGKLPDTLMAKSPSGSLHYFFKYPDGANIRNSESEVAPGVDVRGDGGIVVAVPSVKPGVGCYKWLNDNDVADAPDWLIDRAQDSRRLDALAAYAASASSVHGFENHLATMGDDPGQGFNKVLCRASAAYVAEYGGDFDREEVKARLRKAIEDAPKAPTRDPAIIVRYLSDDYLDPLLATAIKNCGAKADASDKPVAITAEPHAFPPEHDIAKWDFLAGRHLLRRTVSGTAAMGATGKSSLGIVEALALASGKSLLGDRISGALRVLLVNLEDNRNAMDKRIAVAMRHHGLMPEDVGGRLFTKAKGEISFKIASQQKVGSIKRNDVFINAIIELLNEKKIDVFSLDPFVSTHEVNENDNSAIRDVIECYDHIAERANCAVHLWHHTRKGNGNEVTANSARGASSFVDACRSVRVLETMKADEAKKQNIPNPRQYFRAFSGKFNFAPATDNSNWFHITNVEMMNGVSLITGGPGSHGGDNVGVVETWELPVAAELTTEQIAAIREAVGSGQWRENARADLWVGKAIAPILGRENDDPEVKRTIKRLLAWGHLKPVEGLKSDRKPCLFIVPGDEVAAVNATTAGKGLPQ